MREGTYERIRVERRDARACARLEDETRTHHDDDERRASKTSTRIPDTRHEVTWLFLADVDARARRSSSTPRHGSAAGDHSSPRSSRTSEKPHLAMASITPLRSPCRCAMRERAARHTRARRVRLIQVVVRAPGWHQAAVPNPSHTADLVPPSDPKRRRRRSRARAVAARRSSFAGAAVTRARARPADRRVPTPRTNISRVRASPNHPQVPFSRRLTTEPTATDLLHTRTTHKRSRERPAQVPRRGSRQGLRPRRRRSRVLRRRRRRRRGRR